MIKPDRVIIEGTKNDYRIREVPIITQLTEPFRYYYPGSGYLQNKVKESTNHPVVDYQKKFSNMRFQLLVEGRNELAYFVTVSLKLDGTIRYSRITERTVYGSCGQVPLGPYTATDWSTWLEKDERHYRDSLNEIPSDLT